MSGVRIVDPELRALGLSLPGFIERGETIASLPSLGLLTVAAQTPPTWELTYREVDELEGAAEGLLEEGFDLIAISSLTARILDAYVLADRLRSAGTVVVLGGLHASALPAEAALHADAVAVGQGEPLWPRILADFERGELRPRYEHPASERALGRTPRYDLLEVDRYSRITLQTTRGCPLDCAFCGASRLIAPYQRKPIDQVRAELREILRIWPKPFIELADDNTFVTKSWARELAGVLAEFPVRWFTETDISAADDPELLDLLATSGCVQLLIGLESPNLESLRGVDSREWKRRQADRYAERVAAIQGRGISVNGCFVLGFDQDGPSIFEETASLVRELGLAEVQITVLTPFPGTPLFARLAREGRFLRERFWDQCTLFDVTYTPARMSVDELRSGLRSLMGELYSPDEVARRKEILRTCLKNRARS